MTAANYGPGQADKGWDVVGAVVVRDWQVERECDFDTLTKFCGASE